jgi:hypothetical protein
LNRTTLDSLVELREPALLHDLATVQQDLALPASLVSLLEVTDGFHVTCNADEYDIHVYGTAELLERQRTYEIDQYWPGTVLIGTDGGGRGLFLDPGGAVHKCGLGAPGIEHFEPVADSLASWVHAKFDLADEPDPQSLPRC